jgi:hypothetical protein
MHPCDCYVYHVLCAFYGSSKNVCSKRSPRQSFVTNTSKSQASHCPTSGVRLPACIFVLWILKEMLQKLPWSLIEQQLLLKHSVAELLMVCKWPQLTEETRAVVLGSVLLQQLSKGSCLNASVAQEALFTALDHEEWQVACYLLKDHVDMQGLLSLVCKSYPFLYRVGVV